MGFLSALGNIFGTATGLSGVGSALSGLGSVFGGISQRKQQQNQFLSSLQFQREENERARKWNKEMAELYNQWSREAVASERAYNDPRQQMARLAAAGLNPDLMYGAADAGTTSVADVSKPDAVAPANVMSAGMSVPSSLSGMQVAAGVAKTFAEVKNIVAETKKTEGEITSLNLDNAYKAATQGSRIELQNLSVQLNKGYLDLNKLQQQELVQNIQNLQTQNDKMNKEIMQIEAQTRNLDQQTVASRFDMFMRSNEFDLACKKFAQEVNESNSRIKLNYTQAREIATLVYSKKFNLDMQGEHFRELSKLDAAQAVIAGIQGQNMQLSYDWNKDHYEMVQWTNYIGECLGIMGETVGTFFRTAFFARNLKASKQPWLNTRRSAEIPEFYPGNMRY